MSAQENKHSSQNVMILLFGFAGVGKCTIAKEIVSIATGYRLVDNHLINNPIFSLIPIDGKTDLPAKVWDHVDTIWDIVADTMVNLSSPEDSFVMTYVMLKGNEKTLKHFARLMDIAEKRRACFVPIQLEISNVDEHIRRITTPDRAVRFKETDENRPFYYATKKEVLHIDHPHLLKLDVTDLMATDAAKQILSHVVKCYEL